MWAHQPSPEGSQQFWVLKVTAGIAESTTTPAHMTTVHESYEAPNYSFGSCFLVFFSGWIRTHCGADIAHRLGVVHRWCLTPLRTTNMIVIIKSRPVSVLFV